MTAIRSWLGRSGGGGTAATLVSVGWSNNDRLDKCGRRRRLSSRKPYHGSGGHLEAVATFTSMIALTYIVDQEFARHLGSNLTIVPPALLLPKVTRDG